ncbi:MAG: transcriptional regulator, TetR family [Firmicutes bacterium]|nr:transcriptional regulator, TetR family [Bacillota bacterium]
MARPSQDPRIRIAEILDTTENLFTIKGYHGTTISDIAKKMGVTQGMFYYYFKSKEQILEALLNRHISSFISDIKDMTHSRNISPAEKMSLMISIVLKDACVKDQLLLQAVYDEENLKIRDRIARQIKILLVPYGLKFIEEGNQTKLFNAITPQTSLNYILIILEFLVETLYEKVSEETLSERLKMAEALIEKALGAQEGTIHISL